MGYVMAVLTAIFAAVKVIKWFALAGLVAASLFLPMTLPDIGATFAGLPDEWISLMRAGGLFQALQIFFGAMTTKAALVHAQKLMDRVSQA